LSDSSIESPKVGNRMKEFEQAIRSQVNKTTSQEFFWWSATDGASVIADASPTKKQAIAAIADDFRLGAVQRLRLERCHVIEVHGWRIALQEPDESSEDFLDRSCGQKKAAAGSYPIANRHPQTKHSASRRPSTAIARGFRFFNM
jgi:hypothetical protein